jgi:methylase of polypeptide subunit release factors
MSKQLLGLYNLFVEVFDYNATSDVVTPLELAREMARELPTAGTMLVPASGIGTFAVAAVLEGRNPCTITCVEYNKAYSAISTRILERFGIKCIHSDFLTWEPQMQFDVIIGNPPYQDSSTDSKDKKLWTKFVQKSVELLDKDGMLSFVTPTSLVGRTRLPAKMRELLSSEYSLDWLDHNTNGYFPQVGVDVCSWSVSNKEYQGETIVKDNEGQRVIDIREELPLPSALKISDDLAEKIHSAIGNTVPELKREYNDIDQIPAESGEFLNYYSGRGKSFRTNDRCKNTGQLKVVFSFSATYKQWFVTDANVSGTNVYVPVESEEEGIEIGETLMRPVMSFYINNWRRTAGFCPAIKNNGALPDVRGLSDEVIYERFNLTTEEIAYINSGHIEYKTIDRVLKA